MQSTHITSKPKSSVFNPGLLLQHKEILRLLTVRQFILRYKLMKLGALWAILAPASQLLILWLIFGVILHLEAEGFPFLLFVFCGLVPWWFFTNASSVVASSLAENLPIISKIYFPKILLPISSMIKEIVDSSIISLLCIGVTLIYGFTPGPELLLLPLAYLYVAIPALGLGLITACLSIQIKDVRPIFDFGLSIGFYITPLLYSGTIIPAKVQPFYQLNPMYWGTELFRYALLGRPVHFTASFYASTVLSLALLVAGLFIFAHYENRLIDEQ